MIQIRFFPLTQNKISSTLSIFKVGCILAALIGNTALSAENMLWQGNPLQIPILVNTERRIDFPEPIVDINMSAAENKVSQILLTPEGRLFLKPSEVYAPARLKAVSVTGTLYLVDIESKVEGSEVSSETVVIIDPIIHAAGGGMTGAGTGNRPSAMPLSNHPNVAAGNQAGQGQSAQNAGNSNAPNLDKLPDFLRKDMTLSGGNGNGNIANAAPDYIAMSRFAMSHFAGPKRLIPQIAANQVAVKQPGKNWLRVVNNGLETKALAQWSISGHFVTAIYVRNRTNRAIEFDPRGIRGDIAFVSAMHTLLQPRGQSGDEGLWAVVTTQPFNIAINRD